MLLKPNYQTAQRLLHQCGYENPAQVIHDVQEWMTQYREMPLQTMGRLVEENQLVCLGEYHNYEGRYMHPEFIEVAAAHGVKVLFVEVSADEQRDINNFLQTGDLSQLPASCGGDKTSNLLPSDIPYLLMLEKARLCGMKIVAVDTDGGARNKYMADAILNYFCKYPGERGIFVVGQLHLFSRFKSAFTLLKEVLRGGVVTIARACINIYESVEAILQIWALVADVNQPVIVPTLNSPFATLPSTATNNPLIASDFDLLFLHPYPNDAYAQEAVRQEKLLRENHVHPTDILRVAAAMNMSPVRVVELLAVNNLVTEMNRLNELANNGDENARVEAEILAGKMMERISRMNN